jgi:hypothetical protein
MSLYHSAIDTEIIEIVTDEMVKDFIKYRNDPKMVYDSLFGYPAENKDEALNRLNKVYLIINQSKDPQKLYDEYLSQHELETSIMDTEYDPISYEEFVTGLTGSDGDIEDDDDEIISARTRLDEIINSPNYSNILDKIKKQLSYTTLSNEDMIILAMHEYMNTIMPIDIDEIRNIFKITNKIRNILKDVKFILDEQRSTLREYRPCRIWYIDSYHNGIPYGSIEVFYNKKEAPHYVMIQNIVKYPIPILVQTLFPEYNKFMPRLNSVLMEPINTIARDLGADYIYVHPFEEQAAQLEKHYGFRRTDGQWKRPCRTISETMNKISYYKEVEK